MNKENKISFLNVLQVIEKLYLLGIFSLVYVETSVICLFFNQLKTYKQTKQAKKKPKQTKKNNPETTNNEHSEYK